MRHLTGRVCRWWRHHHRRTPGPPDPWQAAAQLGAASILCADMAELAHALSTMLPARPRTGSTSGRLGLAEGLGRHATHRTVFTDIPAVSDWPLWELELRTPSDQERGAPSP